MSTKTKLAVCGVMLSVVGVAFVMGATAGVPVGEWVAPDEYQDILAKVKNEAGEELVVLCIMTPKSSIWIVEIAARETIVDVREPVPFARLAMGWRGKASMIHNPEDIPLAVESASLYDTLEFEVMGLSGDRVIEFATKGMKRAIKSLWLKCERQQEA